MTEALGELLERNGDITFFLAITCFLLAAFTFRKFQKVYSALEGVWNTKMLLMASVTMSSIVRFTTFITLTIVSYSTATENEEGETVLRGRTDFGRSRSVQLYTRSIDVLINVGDYTIISAYFLLLVITLETFQLTRSHPYGTQTFRRTGMITYLTVNTGMYTLQIGLYLGALFSSTETSRDVMQAVYLILSVLNVGVPLICMAMYCCLSCVFSGYPFKSVAAKNWWHSMIRVTAIWTIGRFVWGGVSIFTYDDGWSDVKDRERWVFSVILITLFIFAEVLPITWLLSINVDRLLAYEDRSSKLTDERPRQTQNRPPTPGPRLNKRRELIPQMSMLDVAEFSGNDDDDEYDSCEDEYAAAIVPTSTSSTTTAAAIDVSAPPDQTQVSSWWGYSFMGVVEMISPSKLFKRRVQQTQQNEGDIDSIEDAHLRALGIGPSDLAESYEADEDSVGVHVAEDSDDVDVADDSEELSSDDLD